VPRVGWTRVEASSYTTCCRIAERCRDAGDQRLDLLRLQTAQLNGDLLVLVVGVGGEPAAVDDIRADLDLCLRQ
jgi:hypothetical protein